MSANSRMTVPAFRKRKGTGPPLVVLTAYDAVTAEVAEAGGVDGILIDSERHWQLTERAIFAELGIDLTDELLVETRGLRTEEMVAHWSARFSLDGKDPRELMEGYQFLDLDRNSLAELEAFIGKPIKFQVEALYTQEQYDVVLI